MTHWLKSISTAALALAALRPDAASAASPRGLYSSGLKLVRGAKYEEALEKLLPALAANGGALTSAQWATAYYSAGYAFDRLGHRSRAVDQYGWAIVLAEPGSSLRAELERALVGRPKRYYHYFRNRGMPRLLVLDHLASEADLSPAQKEQAARVIKQSRERLREMWLQCKDAGTPVHVMDLLLRDDERLALEETGRLVDAEQRPGLSRSQRDRRRATVKRRDLQLPAPAELAQPVRAFERPHRLRKAKQFVQQNGLDAKQVEQLRTAEKRETEATAELWLDADLDAVEARAALKRRDEIRQELVRSLEQVLTGPQLDAYTAWREGMVVPQQADAGRRWWWRTKRDVAVDDL